MNLLTANSSAVENERKEKNNNSTPAIESWQFFRALEDSRDISQKNDRNISAIMILSHTTYYEMHFVRLQRRQRFEYSAKLHRWRDRTHNAPIVAMARCK